MDAFNLLKADHRNVAELFEQLESASGKKKLDVFAEIKTELDLHAHIEEKIFYPALERASETHEIVLEAYEEHKQVKTLLRQLSRARNANEQWEAKAKVLQENVEHHVEEEENELFKKARTVLNNAQIEDLGMRLQEEKERKQGASGSKKASKAANKTASTSKSAAKAAKRVSRSSGSKGTKKSGSKKSGRKSAAKKR